MRRPAIAYGVVIAAAALAGAALGADPAPAPAPTPPVRSSLPSPLIYPAESIPLKFDHLQHARLGATCESCHTAALSSTTTADNLIPREADCRACHKIDRADLTSTMGTLKGSPNPPATGSARQSRAAPTRCAVCHIGPDGGGWMPAVSREQPPRVALARPSLKFNHQQHALRGIACALCHGAADTKPFVTREDLPTMALCLGCHTGRDKAPTARCTACHLADADGRVRTALATPATAAIGATGPLVPSGSLRGIDAHGPTFRRDHAVAGRDEGYCLSCHRRNECVDCHGGVVRPPDIHPADYVSLHPADARRNTPDCSSCHRLQTFCVGCHQRSGVAADPEGGLPGHRANNPFGTGTGVKQFHPPGWARDATGQVIATPRPASHSMQAKRNIRACASCHREESCLACHSADPTRGPTFSPHGPGFAATARCRFLAARNRRACLKCHAVTAAELSCQ